MTQATLRQKLEASAADIRAKLGREHLPPTLIVLGSGFKGFVGQLAQTSTVDLATVRGMPVPRIAGHGGALVIGHTWGKAATEVAVLTGRVHLYEGHDASAVAYPIRVLAQLGIQRVLLTNAAGSVEPTLQPGETVLVSDQINLTGASCLAGPEAAELGPVFIDMGQTFDAAWRAGILKQAAGIKEGVYAGVRGPAYETPAETRMLGRLGAQVVGMSTVQEVLAARQLGLAVACLSFVTNMAGGLGGQLDHAEVLALVARHQGPLHELLALAAGVVTP